MTALMPAGTTASRSSRHLLMMGYKKHSVLPDPVSVETTVVLPA